MNVSYYEKNNKAYITNENDEERVIDTTDNIEDILITENNIEDLELELKYKNEELKRIKKEEKQNKFYKIILSLVNIITIVIVFLPTNVATKLVFLFGIAGYNVVSNRIFSFTKTSLKELNIELELTLEQLEREKEKLELLKTNSKNKDVKYKDVKEIEESESLVRIICCDIPVEKYSLEQINSMLKNDLKKLKEPVFSKRLIKK